MALSVSYTCCALVRASAECCGYLCYPSAVLRLWPLWSNPVPLSLIRCTCVVPEMLCHPSHGTDCPMREGLATPTEILSPVQSVISILIWHFWLQSLSDPNPESLYLISSLLLAFSLPPLLLYPLLLFHPQPDQCKSFTMECHDSTVNEAI